MKYMILMNNDTRELEHEVNSYLDIGWELYGPPFTTQQWEAGVNGQAVHQYHQVMIKPEAT